jgi:fatty-acyl-CoA synthase
MQRARRTGAVLYGAAPMSPARLIEGLERLGPIFSQAYGQTECLPISVLRRADHDLNSPERLASCGFPACSSEVRLLDEEGHPVPPVEPGEICVRSPAVIDAYLNQLEQTAEALAGGWLHTATSADRMRRATSTSSTAKRT